jgi:crossover junction endodeoxyribonuclease RuvC
MKHTVIFGVDIGQRGAIVRLNDDGSLHDAHVMPLGYEGIQWHRVHELLSECSGGAIEWVNAMPSRGGIRMGATSAFSFGGSFEGVKACLQIAGVPFVEIRASSWKKKVLTGTDKSKDSAIEFAKERFPGINMTPGRLRKPHDGIGDAACIAEWYYITQKENLCQKKMVRKKRSPKKNKTTSE